MGGYLLPTARNIQLLDGPLLEGRQIDSMNYPDQKGKSNCYATDLGNAAKKNRGSNTMTWQHTLETGGVKAVSHKIGPN